MNYNEIIENLKNDIDWREYAVLISQVSTDAPLNKNRFGKSDIQMQIFESLTEKLKFVNKIGYDFEYKYEDKVILIEDKSQENFFHNPVKKDGSSSIKKEVRVMLKNTMGNKIVNPSDYIKKIKFDILLLRQIREDSREQWVGYLERPSVKEEWLIIKKDQIILKIPAGEIKWIYQGTKQKNNYSNKKPFSIAIEAATNNNIKDIKLLLKEQCDYENNDYCI